MGDDIYNTKTNRRNNFAVLPLPLFTRPSENEGTKNCPTFAGVLCKDGTWANAKGKVTCDVCDPGQYCTQEDDSTLSIATDCPIGWVLSYLQLLSIYLTFTLHFRLLICQ